MFRMSDTARLANVKSRGYQKYGRICDSLLGKNVQSILEVDQRRFSVQILMICSSLHRRCATTARSQQLPPRAQKARPLHQNPAQRAGKGVRRQQVHHQR